MKFYRFEIARGSSIRFFPDFIISQSTHQSVKVFKSLDDIRQFARLEKINIKIFEIKINERVNLADYQRYQNLYPSVNNKSLASPPYWTISNSLFVESEAVVDEDVEIPKRMGSPRRFINRSRMRHSAPR